MTGNPQLGSNIYLSLDATALAVTDATGVASTVMPLGTPFKISVTWQLAGSWANWFTNVPTNVYNILYAFESLTNDPDDRKFPTGPLAFTPNQLIYKDPDTTVDVGGGVLNVGVYQVSAIVTFPTNPLPFPASAFFSSLVLEVF